MKYTYITYTLFAGLFFLSFGTQAQDRKVQTKDILAMEQESEFLQWNKSTNAAGLLIDQPTKVSLVEAGYQYYEGNFRRPQADANGSQLFLNTHGNLFLKNYYVEGYFSYKRHNRHQAEYNAGLIDPFRNMPYLVADTNASDWLNQHYNLGFKVTTPKIADKWSFGLTADYEASSGAKQRDIRAMNKFYSLNIEPGVIFSASDAHHFGASFLYKNYKEESENTNINNYVSQNYFVLYGLGNAINYVGTGRTMNYQGDALGGGLQYQFKGDISLLASANYTIQAEDANIGFTNSLPHGSILQKKWDFNLNAEKESRNFKHLVDARYTSSKSNGIEYVSEFISDLESDGYYVRHKSIRSKYDYNSAQLAYHIVRKKGDAYGWKANVRAAYDKLDNRYLIPASSMMAENITYGVSINKSFDLSSEKSAKLSLGINLDFRTNLDGHYNYVGPDMEELTVVDLEQGNFQYFSSDFNIIEVPLVYSQRLKQESTFYFIKASGHLQTTSSYNFNNRKGFLLSFGATF